MAAEGIKIKRNPSIWAVKTHQKAVVVNWRCHSYPYGPIFRFP